MPMNKFMLNKKIGKGLLLSILVVWGAYFFWADLYTKAWHPLNPNPLKWKNVIITVPKNFVRWKLSGEEKLMFCDLTNSCEPSVIFEYLSKPFIPSQEFAMTIIGTGYRVRESVPCPELGKDCLWLKATKKEGGEVHYSEDVFIGSKKLWITFYGKMNQRYRFLEVLESLIVAKNNKFET